MRFSCALATFNFGRSIAYREPVMDLISGRIGASLKLQLASLILVLVTALPLGVLAATHRGKFADHFVRLVAALSQSAPGFWVGLALTAISSVKLRWLPAGGMGPGGIESLKYCVLPAITTSLLLLASISRLLRSAMLESLDSEFVELARAKGV